MNPDELQQTLSKLHDELSQTTSVDEPVRAKLAELIADIERVLARSESESTRSPQGALARRLQDAIEAFEVRHPQLTATLQQIVDRLSEIGI